MNDDNIMDYIFKAEMIITALRNAGQRVEDDLPVAMVLNGLPESCTPFSVNIVNMNYSITFVDLKTRLRR